MTKTGWIILALVVAIAAIIGISSLNAKNQPNDLTLTANQADRDLKKAGEKMGNRLEESADNVRDAVRTAGHRVSENL